jgi:hypothetical protein
MSALNIPLAERSDYDQRRAITINAQCYQSTFFVFLFFGSVLAAADAWDEAKCATRNSLHSFL